MGRIGLTLNEAKTRIRQADAERFDFLGYTFGPHRFRKDGYVYLGMSPSQKSVARLREKVEDLIPNKAGSGGDVLGVQFPCPGRQNGNLGQTPDAPSLRAAPIPPPCPALAPVMNPLEIHVRFEFE